MTTDDALTALRGPLRLRCPCGVPVDVDYSLEAPEMWVAHGHGPLRHEVQDVIESLDCLAVEDYDDAF